MNVLFIHYSTVLSSLILTLELLCAVYGWNLIEEER